MSTGDFPDERGRRALSRLRTTARLWDELVQIPVIGRRIGIDALIGLVPGVGDAAGALVAGVGVVWAARYGAPFSVLIRMLGNIGLDALVGTVPLLGDLFDVGWRAQTRNVRLLERWLDNPDATRRSSRLVVASVAALMIGLVLAVCWLVVMLLGWLIPS